MSSKRLARSLVALVAAVSLGGCGAAQHATPPPTSPATAFAPAPLTIYAASSLKDVLSSASELYQTGHDGATLVISTDSSSALEAKIEQGAPADVFLSADEANPRKLVDGGFAAGAPLAFATNLLTIIVAPGNPAGITSPFDLARPGVKVIAAGDTVPITKYASLLVHNLAGLPGAPAGFEAAYAANVVTKVQDVRAVITQVLLGQGDAAIVYVTDAKAGGALDTVAITPASANVVATYAGVVVKGSAQQAAAQAFLTWLVGPQGRAALQGFGFLPPAG